MWSSTPPIDGRKKSLSIKTQCFRRATTGDDADVDGASSAWFGARRGAGRGGARGGGGGGVVRGARRARLGARAAACAAARCESESSS